MKRIALAVFALLVVAGCSTTALMPTSDEQSVDGIGWKNYGEAEEFYNQIETGKTTTDELARRGLDPKKSKNIVVLDRTTLMSLFMVNVPGSFEFMDNAVKECLRSGTDCVPYVVRKDESKEEGRGSFLTRFFGFKKESVVYGWNVEMLLLVHRDVVVWKQIKGTPNGTERYKKESKPLGPLEGGGGRLLRW